MKTLLLSTCLLATTLPGSIATAAPSGLLSLDTDQIMQVELKPSAASSREVRLQRIELRARGARTLVVSGQRSTVLDDDAADYFLGEDARGVRWGLLHRDGRWSAASAEGGLLAEFELSWVGTTGALRSRPQPAQPLSSSCGTDAALALESGVALPVQLPPLAGLGLRPERAINAPQGVSGTATLAIDTDNEWLFRRFGNNTTAASAWVDEMILQMNVMYERDLSLRTLRGTTLLRVDPSNPPTFDDDPWNNTDTPASNNQLIEFGTWWQNNQSATPRAFAMLLSGKSGSGFSASGIAWVDRYCDNSVSGGGSYSINQAFWDSGVSVASSLRVIAHEIGHNLGSVHTHCYNPPVDQCYRAEPGCYTGSVSCPGGGAGTLMSYCNFSPPNGAGCGSNQLQIHPTVASRIGQSIAANSPGCIMPLGGGGDEIFDDGFE